VKVLGPSWRPIRRVARSDTAHSGSRQAMEFEGRPTEGTNDRSKTAKSEGWGPARPRVGTLGRQEDPRPSPERTPVWVGRGGLQRSKATSPCDPANGHKIHHWPDLGGNEAECRCSQLAFCEKGLGPCSDFPLEA
jgi:hypothetical protein